MMAKRNSIFSIKSPLLIDDYITCLVYHVISLASSPQMKYQFYRTLNKILLIGGLIFLPFLSKAQQGLYKLDEFDSLHSLLKTEISDSLRFVALIDVAERFAFVDLDSGVYYFEEAKKLEGLVTDTTWIANLYLVGAKIYDHRLTYDSTKKMIKKAVSLSKAIDNNLGIEMGYDLLGGVYSELGELDSALFFHRLGLQYADSIGKAIGYNNIGIILVQLGKVKEASEYYVKSLDYLDKAYEYADYYLVNFYSNIGVLKSKQKELEEAKKYYRLAIAAGENTGRYPRG